MHSFLNFFLHIIRVICKLIHFLTYKFIHDLTFLYTSFVVINCRHSCLGARLYDSSREQRNAKKILKKEALLSTESIRNVATKTCCSRSCLQPFPCDKIEALRFEMHVEGSVYHRKHRQLDVHKQIHRDADGKEMITLEGFEVCSKAWMTIMGLHR